MKSSRPSTPLGAEESDRSGNSVFRFAPQPSDVCKSRPRSGLRSQVLQSGSPSGVPRTTV